MFTPDRNKNESNFKSQVYQMAVPEIETLVKWMRQASKERNLVSAGDISIDATVVSVNWVGKGTLIIPLGAETIQFLEQVRLEMNIFHTTASEEQVKQAAETLGADAANYAVVPGYEDLWYEGCVDDKILITGNNIQQPYIISRSLLEDIANKNLARVPLRPENDSCTNGAIVRHGDVLYHRKRLPNDIVMYFEINGNKTYMGV